MKTISLFFVAAAAASSTVRANTPDGRSPDVIDGAAGTAFIEIATGTGQFGIPAAMYFDRHGCLRWSDFGLENDDWHKGLDTALQSPVSTGCEKPVLGDVLDRLASDGVSFDMETVTGHPVVIWYGNDDLCQPCAEKTRTHWPEIRSKLPQETQVFMLTWK